MKELRGPAARSRGPVVPLDQRDPEPPERGVPRHPCPVDPASHNEQIVVFLLKAFPAGTTKERSRQSQPAHGVLILSIILG
jgi:hypothetical protein